MWILATFFSPNFVFWVHRIPWGCARWRSCFGQPGQLTELIKNHKMVTLGKTWHREGWQGVRGTKSPEHGSLSPKKTGKVSGNRGGLSWTWILNCLRGSSVRYLDSPSGFSLASALSCLWQSIVFKQWNSYCCWPRSMLYDITCVGSSLVTSQHVYLERPALGIFDLRVCIGNLCLLSGTAVCY